MCCLSKNNIFSFNSFLMASGLLVFSGCALVNPDVELPEHNLSKTGVSAATGAVIGAGLGTLVGSTTGNAGEGFVLGSLAGAATGGLIGRKFEEQEIHVDNQAEVITRQQRIIEKQRLDIEQMKIRMEDDSLVHRSQPSYGNQASYGNQGASTRFNDQFSKSSAPSSYSGARYYASQRVVTKVPEAPVYDDNARSKPYGVNRRHRAGVQKEVFGAGAVKTGFSNTEKNDTKVIAPSSSAILESSIPVHSEAQRGRLKSEVKNIEVPVIVDTPRPVLVETRKEKMQFVPIVESEKLEQRVVSSGSGASHNKPVVQEVRSEKKENVNKTGAKTSKPSMVVSKKSDPACQRAAQEAEKAEVASSAADRLFYFRRALRFCPSEAEYHVEISKVYSSIGRIDDAKYELAQALKISPGSSAAKSELERISN